MIYPAIVNEGKEAAYLSLIQFMQQLAVEYPATINYATRSAAPPQNAILSARYMSRLDGHFLGLRQDAAAQ